MANLEGPFFVLGAVRSGTTLLRLMLGHHPEICRCEEFDFSVESLGEGPDLPAIVTFHERLEMHRGFRQSGYSIDTTLNHFDLLRAFLESRRRDEVRPLVGATVHSAFTRLHEIWPNAKYVYLRRDPRDVSRSIVAMGWAGTSWHATQRWVEVELEWQRLRERIDPEHCLEVRFEDLVDDPELVLDRICEFLGVTFDPDMLEIERDTTYKRPRSGAASSWKTAATPMEVRLAEAAANELLVPAGYEPSGLPPLTVNPIIGIVLALQDRLNRVRFSIQRYGPRLWLAGAMSRRLPFRRWRRDVELRAQDIMNQHMT